eukprot:12900823-Prorocentrum_lima.AAC.1
MDEKYNKDCDDPNQDNLQTLEKAEDKLIDTRSYQCGSEFGGMHAEYLWALDFLDMLTEDL